jgi:GH24 family phage-related lysozyme (muramidase)
VLEPSLMKKIGDDLDLWESPTQWMYLDSRGYVTVGCGSMLPTAASATAIDFYHEQTFKPASANEIESAWNTLNGSSSAQRDAAPQKKFAALHYRTASDLRITVATAKLLRDRHVQNDYRGLKLIYPHFDEFPENAKLALFDMAYNLGVGHHAAHHHKSTGLTHFVHMNAAVNKHHWLTAALHCSRHGIPPERNNMTAALFRSCHSAAKKGAVASPH